MFRASFVAHHCWLFEGGRSRILIDPLFKDDFSLTPSTDLIVYPPRGVDFAAFPPVDAVFLTHEHEGHFEIPSLHHLDRRVPIYMSSRSSSAMRQILKEMGFDVRLQEPGVKVEVGDLNLLPMTADQVRTGIIEEWDVLPYLVWDKGGHGNFFTNVDMQATEAMWRLARTEVKAPGLWAHTNNHMSWHFLFDWVEPELGYVRQYAPGVAAYHAQLSAEWARPEALLVVGGGFAFGGERSWVNRNIFIFEGRTAAEALAPLLPGERVLAPVPGQAFVLEAGKLVSSEERAPFVRQVPEKDWPSRKYAGDLEWLESYAPACGRTELRPGELEELRRELDGFAAHLYSGNQFRGLYSLTASDLEGHKPAAAMVLREGSDGGAYVFEYDPTSCAFAPVESEDPASEYLCVHECWATDLLEQMRCALSSTAVSFGRFREWNAKPAALRFDFNHALFEYLHPLRFPKRFLELYRKTLARQPKQVPLIRRNG